MWFRNQVQQFPRSLVFAERRAPFGRERIEAMLNQNKRSAKMPWAMATWALGVAILGASAQAGSIQFNPTGTSGGQVFTINGIDLAPGSALAVGALPLTVGQTFQLDYQAT